MSILSGLIKEKRYKKTANGYKLTSQYTDSTTVNMPNGQTASTNLGAIKGITSSSTTTESGWAADAASTNTRLNSLNSSLANCFQSVSDGKRSIASAITDNGVPTAADATFQVMSNNIRNGCGCKISRIGGFNGQSSGTFDIKNYTNNWSKLNNNNFWGRAASKAHASGGSGNHDVYASPSISYNSSNGILTVSSGQSGEAHVTTYVWYSDVYLFDGKII